MIHKFIKNSVRLLTIINSIYNLHQHFIFSIILIYTSFTYKNWSLSMLWNFHISSGDIYNGTDYFMTARSMSVRFNSLKPLNGLHS